MAALSLMETMVATAISALLLAVIFALSSYTVRSFAAISNYVALDRGSRHTLDRLSKMKRLRCHGTVGKYAAARGSVKQGS